MVRHATNPQSTVRYNALFTIYIVTDIVSPYEWERESVGYSITTNNNNDNNNIFESNNSFKKSVHSYMVSNIPNIKPWTMG